MNAGINKRIQVPIQYLICALSQTARLALMIIGWQSSKQPAADDTDSGCCGTAWKTDPLSGVTGVQN